jgi:galactose oxidase-like protein/Kelch motif protein
MDGRASLWNLCASAFALAAAFVLGCGGRLDLQTASGSGDQLGRLGNGQPGDGAPAATGDTDAGSGDPPGRPGNGQPGDGAPAATGDTDAGALSAGAIRGVVLMGGDGDTGFLGDTWQWNGAQWSQASPAHSPPARWFASAATMLGRVVLFGGSIGNSGPYLNDGWQWDGSDWTPQSPAQAPPPRMCAATAILNGKLLLFGGATTDLSAGTVLHDTWVWDGTSWTQQHPAQSPRGRVGAAAAVASGRVVLFSGDDGTGTALVDTWTWDGTSWTLASPAQSPPPRYLAAAATLNGRAVVFGGYGLSGGNDFDDTWAWDGSNWTQEHPAQSPSARTSAAAAVLDDHVVLFGGVDRRGYLGDTWTWDGTNWAQASSAGPSPRSGAAMSGP